MIVEPAKVTIKCHDIYSTYVFIFGTMTGYSKILLIFTKNVRKMTEVLEMVPLKEHVMRMNCVKLVEIVFQVGFKY